MGLESITQKQIDELIAMEKCVTNPRAREKTKGQHTERDFKLVDSRNEHSFKVFVRAHIILKNNFSCGLLWYIPSGETLTLRRYNGSSHSHKNHLENVRFAENCHIHKAKETYIAAGIKADGFAEETDRYDNVETALQCLILDCNISGFHGLNNQQNLF